jgi:hypothetical protein
MKGYLIFIFFLYFCCLSAYSQQIPAGNRILFRGVVISSPSQERLSGSQIYINSIPYASSRSDGTFSFYANKLDTVVFTMLGYKPAVIVVSDTLKSKEFLTGVFLKSDTIEIGEVVIVPRYNNLRAEIMKPLIVPNTQLDNAKSNITIASYVGRTSMPEMGDPDVNYDVIRGKQMRAAYEKGGIPSDQMVGLNPFLLIPAAYLLLHGLPEAPKPPEPNVSQKDLDELNKLYLETVKKR